MQHSNTQEQNAVIEARKRDGYVLLGVASSRSMQGHVVVLTKKRHCVAINGLGYDEHTLGSTWRMLEGA